MMIFPADIFRKYDIRGIFPEQLTEDLVTMLGRILTRLADGPVAIGRDCRPSGALLQKWLTSGCRSEGGLVIDLGVQTTPMTYFAANTHSPGVTVMITGSHNPSEYNGFKIMKGLDTVFGDDIQAIRETMEEIAGHPEKYPASELSPEPVSLSIRTQYIERLVSEFCFDRSLKVVVDGGNGTGGELACEVLEALGCRIVPLYCEMDGTFPNHHPDPTVESNLTDLREMVLKEKADVGIAYDGDADRLGVLDADGSVIWGDRILILLARSLLQKNPGATIISEVKASRLFFDEVAAAGGRAVMAPTGHSLIKRAMTAENALLAGEMSGHVFFRDRYYGFDDALYATLRLLEVLASSHATIGELLSDLPAVFSTPELREDCPDVIKFSVVDEVVRMLKKEGRTVDTLDGARIEFPDGWGLVRASNTQPVLVLRFEAGTKEALRKYESYVRSLINTAGRTLEDATQTD